MYLTFGHTKRKSLLRQSGGLLEITSLARASELSRPTTISYLDALELTHAVHVVRPYHAGGTRELVRQPRVYGFDTGFVAHVRGWSDLRPDDCGVLWEHLVLDTLGSIPNVRVHHWRDKQRREVDFVVPRERGACVAIECKWSASGFDPTGLRAFRALHPRGENLVVVPRRGAPLRRRYGDLAVRIVWAGDLRRLLG